MTLETDTTAMCEVKNAEMKFARVVVRRDRFQFVLAWQVRRPVCRVPLSKLVVVVVACVYLAPRRCLSEFQNLKISNLTRTGSDLRRETDVTDRHALWPCSRTPTRISAN